MVNTQTVHLAALLLVMGIISLVYSVSLEFAALHLGLQLSLAAVLFFSTPAVFRISRLLYLAALLPLIFMAIVHADNLQTYGPVLIETIDAVFQTDQTEAISYLTLFSTDKLVPMVIICSLVVGGSLFASEVGRLPVYQPLGVLMLGVCALYAGRSLPLLVIDTARAYQETLSGYRESRQSVLAGIGPVSAPLDRNVIVVMGESTSRHHLSVYGYPRDTTPFLESLGDELDVYLDVIATHSHTVESLSQALTFGPRGEFPEMTESADVVSVAGLAGVETWWLSNQNPIGIWDNAVAAMAAESDKVIYHDPSTGLKRKREVHDEVMLASLQDALSGDSGKLIFVHMMATHFPYCEMVPDAFEVRALRYDEPVMNERFFGNHLRALSGLLAEEGMVTYFSSLNCYDRAVNYVDMFLEQVVGLAKKSGHPTAVVYLADHGEAPILNNGHDSRQHSHRHVEIPFVVWRSSNFPPYNAVPGRRASLEDLSFGIVDLLGVAGIEDTSSRSIFSDSYVPYKRDTLNGRLGYDNFDAGADHIERARANLLAIDDERVWAHRINTGASLQEAAEIFSGVELDVVFVDGEFRVFHPPAPDIGLTLQRQLTQEVRAIEYWLDWKNASIGNVEAALGHLADLDASFDISARTLVEISALDGSADRITAAGWRASYYLPTAEIAACMSSCDVSGQQQLAEKLLGNFEKQRFAAMSFDAALMSFVEDHLLKYIETHSVPAYTWATAIDISAQGAPSEVAPVLQRAWLEGVLVSLPSYFKW